MRPGLALAETPKAYRVVARIKNNRLWTAIQLAFPDAHTQADAARCLGFRYASHLGRLLNMTYWPWSESRGRWTPLAVAIADQLRETPEYLFDGELYGHRPEPISVAIEPSQLQDAGLLALSPAPDDVLEDHARTKALDEVMQLVLKPREVQVLRLYLGMDGPAQTLEEIGPSLSVTRERVRQMHAKAIRKLRCSKRFREVAETYGLWRPKRRRSFLASPDVH